MLPCTVAYLPNHTKVTTKQWKEMVSDAYIWLDYMSVPQIGSYLDAGMSDLTKAVESIPAYGELVECQRQRTPLIPPPVSPQGHVHLPIRLPSSDRAAHAVEKASHFFAVTPYVQHRDLPSVICNYGSWLKRGWCRLEMVSLLLSRFSEMPVIVVSGPECSPHMISPSTVMARPPGGGELTWCVLLGLGWVAVACRWCGRCSVHA